MKKSYLCTVIFVLTICGAQAFGALTLFEAIDKNDLAAAKQALLTNPDSIFEKDTDGKLAIELKDHDDEIMQSVLDSYHLLLVEGAENQDSNLRKIFISLFLAPAPSTDDEIKKQEIKKAIKRAQRIFHPDHWPEKKKNEVRVVVAKLNDFTDRLNKGKVSLDEDEEVKSIFTCIENNNVDCIKELLKDNPFIVNVRDPSMTVTPLAYAINQNDIKTHSHVNIINYLISQGADINAACSLDPNLFTGSPLHLAAYLQDIEMVKLLLDNKASVNTVTQTDKQTPLFYAIVNSINQSGAVAPHVLDIVKLLVEKSADYNAVDSRGETPLHAAIDQGEYDVVKYLLDQGVDIKKLNSNGNDYLFYAVFVYDLDKDENHHKVLMALIEHGGFDLNVKFLSDQKSLLHWAIEWDDADLVRAFCEAGVDPNVKDKNGKTPLELASEKKLVDIENILQTTKPSLVTIKKLLQEMPSLINHPGVGGNTPLHMAQEVNIITYLLHKGADINALNDAGWTPLFRALFQSTKKGSDKNKYRQAAITLINHGADVKKATTKSKTTPLHFAVDPMHDEELVRLLFNAGADKDISNVKGKSPLGIARKKGLTNIIKILNPQVSELQSLEKLLQFLKAKLLELLTMLKSLSR